MAPSRIPPGPLNRPAANAYSIERVSMEYRSRRNGKPTEALRNVSVVIEVGEIVAIVGRSGSGKSSLLQLMAGLDKPKSGTIICRPEGSEDDAYQLDKMSEDERAAFRGEHVGFVFQAFHLLPALTAWENIAVPLMFAGKPLKERREAAHDLLEELGMRSLSERYPYELSGGQQQRIAIARALANQPSVLLADEPTGNLDTKSAQNVTQMLLTAHKTRDITTIIVTHDHDVASELTARKIELEDGAVLHDSTMDIFS